MHGADNPASSMAHEQSVELLPWYVNSSLLPAEHDRVRAHLSACLVCRRELRRLEQLARVIAEPAVEQASAQAFVRLTQQIEAQTGPRLSRGWLLRQFNRLRDAIEPLPLVSAAAVMVLSVALLSAIALGGRSESTSDEQGFQTLGARPAGRSELSRPHMRVVLRDDVGPTEVASWLERHQAEVVEGPSAIGVLTVQVDVGQRTMQAALGEIRDDQRTLFVEPVDFVGSRPDRRR